MKKVLPTPASGMRRHKRYIIHHTKIKLYKENIFKLFKKEIHETFLINISQGGFQTVSRNAIKIEDDYKVALDVPVLGQMSVKARALWTKPFMKEFHGRYYRSGFIYTHVSSEVSTRLSSMDDDILGIHPDPTRHWGYLPEEFAVQA